MNAMPEPKKPETDEKRKAMIAAAQAYDEVQRELTSLKDQLHTAVAGLEAKNSEIAELRAVLGTQRAEFTKLLDDERANVQISNQARDQAYAERADALALLSAVEAVLERARDGGGLPARRKRNGKHVVDVVEGIPGAPVIGLADIVGPGGGPVPEQAGGGA